MSAVRDDKVLEHLLFQCEIYLDVSTKTAILEYLAD